MAAAKQIIYPLVAQHAAEAAFLWMQRRDAVSAPNLSLRQLEDHDQRIAAHLDGVRLADDAGEAACAEQLADNDPGAIFVEAALAIESGKSERLERVLALSEAVPDAQCGLFAALGWSESRDLRGLVARMLSSQNPFRRFAGTVACSMCRVDPGIISARRLEDPDAHVRARALRAAGELGRHEHVSRLLDWLADEDPACRFWAAWSAVLLGDQNRAHESLLSAGSCDGPERSRAFQLALMAMDVESAHGVLQQMAQDAAALRWLILGSGFAGDPHYVGWLINRMKEDNVARVAGHAFSVITGVDLTALNLRRQRPAGLDARPNDDPLDPDVSMDADEALAWPDPLKVEAWWHLHSHRFTTGIRYFMGEPLNPEICRRVLREGYQSERMMAALHLSLLNAGTPLFEWRAPSWRQRVLLAEMG